MMIVADGVDRCILRLQSNLRSCAATMNPRLWMVLSVRERKYVQSRRIAVVTLSIIVAVIAFAVLFHPAPKGSAGARSSTSASPTSTASGVGAQTQRLVISAAPWRLNTAVSRPAVFAEATSLLLAGGLSPTGASSSSITHIEVATGAQDRAGQLAVPTHDAGAATLGSTNFIFGGGTTSSIATVQALTPGTPAAVVASLPQPRSDLAAVTVGRAIYIVGGYNGNTESGTILRSTDGTHFTEFATLPITVRYPAVAVRGATIWVMGGEHHGKPVALIQGIDTNSGRVTRLGALPQALSHSAALVIDGNIVLAGGRSPDGSATSAVVEFGPDSTYGHLIGHLSHPVSDAGAAVVGGVGYILGGQSTTPTSSVSELRMVSAPAAPATPLAASPRPLAWMGPAIGVGHLAPGSNPAALPGPVLIADKLNNRLIVVDPQGRIRWTFPRPGDLAKGQTFLIPDDAFFSPNGREIIATQEDDSVVSVIDIATHRIVYQYGSPGHPGSGPNRVHNPDDALLLPDGSILMADIKNCRVLLVAPGAHTPHRIFGHTGACRHRPPQFFGSPNGAFPMADGDALVTEINGSWVNELTLNGSIRWSLHLPGIAYPSDTNEISPNRYLTVDYSSPGQILIFNKSGHVFWRYRPQGNAALNHPSLALPLPNGFILLNDDYNHRVIVVDPATNKVVWQYGHTGKSGIAAGYLDNPDGVDLLPPYSLITTHG
jgi:Kelch motif